MKFSEAPTVNDLIQCLNDMSSQMQNTHNQSKRFVYHYTKSSAAVNILKSKRWYAGSPKNMNDGLELIHLEDTHASNLFFASFVSENSESIAMWSMYSQPWSDGVIIKIPVERIKQWIKNDPCIYAADIKTKEVIENIPNAKATLHYVSYTNEDSENDVSRILLTCGNQENEHLGKILDNPTTSGYVKNNAWSYEKELRLRVSVESSTIYEAVLIDIPHDVLDSFEFITGPRYEGNFLSQMRSEVDKRFDMTRIQGSLYTGRLNWVYCQSCPFRKSMKTPV